MAEQLSPRALCTLEDARAAINPDEPTDETRDTDLIRLVNAFSRRVHGVARREFVAINAVRDPDDGTVTVAPQTRVFDVDVLDRAGELEIGDLASFTSATVTAPQGTPVMVAAGDAVALPRVREEWEPITRLRLLRMLVPSGGTLEVTGVWGFPQVPDDIREQTIEAVRMHADRDIVARSDSYSSEFGSVPATRALPQALYDCAIDYRRRARIVSIRVGR